MKRTGLIILLAWLLVGTGKTQERGGPGLGHSIQIGPELYFPAGNSSNVRSIGAGLSLKGELALSPDWALTGQGVFTAFRGRKLFGNRQATMISLPLKGGVKYYSGDNFYIEGQLGAALPVRDGGNTTLVWSPGFGSMIRSRHNRSLLDLGIRYEGWTGKARLNSIDQSSYTTFSFVALKAAYTLR